MIQKSITLGFGMLLSVSAPTQMAIDLAIKYNVALGGFIKKDKIVAIFSIDLLTKKVFSLYGHQKFSEYVESNMIFTMTIKNQS